MSDKLLLMSFTTFTSIDVISCINFVYKTKLKYVDSSCSWHFSEPLSGIIRVMTSELYCHTFLKSDREGRNVSPN